MMENKESDSLLEFEEFSIAVSRISNVADTYTTVSSNKYLAFKLVEALTLILNKDFNDPKHWQTLAVYVNTGLARAVKIHKGAGEVSKQHQEVEQAND